MKKLEEQGRVIGWYADDAELLQAWAKFPGSEINWRGTSNLQPLFWDSKEKKWSEPVKYLKDLNDCFRLVKYWIIEKSCECGFVRDYTNKIIYYDTEKSLNMAKKLEPGGYFTKFIKKDFTKEG